ncbi:MAG: NAD(P)H-dependent glycerol-3-phosphate dehydrogenase, partial [Halothiobacillaceae bacterium]
MLPPHNKVMAVLGAGSWGIALAMVLARCGRATVLWGRDEESMEQLQRERCSTRYLPGVTLPHALTVSSHLETTVAAATELLIAVPSHAFRALLLQIAPLLRPDIRLLWATKGFELGTGQLFHEVVAEVLGPEVVTAIISGPTFAGEVARNMPTAVTIASFDPLFARTLAERFHNENFRVYTSNDMIGVEVGGAVKNVFAIAAGISDGLGFGANARAALITRAV